MLFGSPHIEFPALEQVVGDLYVHGNYTQFQIPSIQDIGGNVDVQSSSPLFQCLSNLRFSGVKGVSFVCRGDVTNLTDAGHSSAARLSRMSKFCLCNEAYSRPYCVSDGDIEY